jgi:hypothetical protein
MQVRHSRSCTGLPRMTRSIALNVSLMRLIRSPERTYLLDQTHQSGALAFELRQSLLLLSDDLRRRVANEIIVGQFGSSISRVPDRFFCRRLFRRCNSLAGSISPAIGTSRASSPTSAAAAGGAALPPAEAACSPVRPGRRAVRAMLIQQRQIAYAGVLQQQTDQDGGTDQQFATYLRIPSTTCITQRISCSACASVCELLRLWPCASMMLSPVDSGQRERRATRSPR